MMCKLQTTTFIFLLLLVPVSQAADRIIEVNVADDLGSVQVTVNAGMTSLQPKDRGLRDSLRILENARWQSRNLIAVDPGLPVRYEVTLRHSTTQWGIARWHGDIRLSDWTDWLLVPVDWSVRTPFRLNVWIPDDGSAVLPFQLLDYSPGSVSYKAYPVMSGHGGLTVFGDVGLEQIAYNNKSLTMAVIGDDGETNTRLFEWMRKVVDAAVKVHGTAPDAHIIAVPVPYVRGVVPWAHVRRGGGSHVIAYVSRDATEDELLEDWTLFHEMTHLYHPYLKGSGRWVSEGFASYYQNLYRAEAGVVTPEHAYSRLQAGLRRGQKENERNGHRPVTSGGRMRTYWTGAAMALVADAEIRLHTNGEETLASVMGSFAKHRLPAMKSWYPRDYLAALDNELGMEVLVPLYERYKRDRYFPEPGLSREQVDAIFRKRL